jgi:hypothetical protein
VNPRCGQRSWACWSWLYGDAVTMAGSKLFVFGRHVNRSLNDDTVSNDNGQLYESSSFKSNAYKNQPFGSHIISYEPAPYSKKLLPHLSSFRASPSRPPRALSFMSSRHRPPLSLWVRPLGLALVDSRGHALFKLPRYDIFNLRMIRVRVAQGHTLALALTPASNRLDGHDRRTLTIINGPGPSRPPSVQWVEMSYNVH